MIIFLYGQDTYRSSQKLNEIIEHYKKIHKTGLNFKIFDLEKKISYQDFKDEWRQAPMFSEKKLIILKNIFSDSEFKEEFLKDGKYFEEKKDVILVYEKGQPRKSSLFSFLKNKVKSQEFKVLTGESLRRWAIKEFKDYKIKPGALDKLIIYVGSDLWQFSNEIKKLINFKMKSQVPVISEEDVELLVKSKIETDIFKTIDAIATKNKKEALKYIHKHLEKGDSPLYLLSMINFQFRNLLILKERLQSLNNTQMFQANNLSKELKMHPYVIKKTTWQARNFTLEELKKIYHKIFEVDLNIKTGRIEAETALDLLITEI